MVALKREKMACQRSMTQKKRERKWEKRGNHVWKKYTNRFVATIEGGVSVTKAQHPSIAEVGPTMSTPFSKSSYPDLPSPKDRVQTLAGSITLSSTKALSILGKTEDKYCPGEDNKSWVLRGNHFGELSHVFKKSFLKMSPDGLWIYKQVSITLWTVLTLNSPRQGDS